MRVPTPLTSRLARAARAAGRSLGYPKWVYGSDFHDSAACRDDRFGNVLGNVFNSAVTRFVAYPRCGGVLFQTPACN